MSDVELRLNEIEFLLKGNPNFKQLENGKLKDELNVI